MVAMQLIHVGFQCCKMQVISSEFDAVGSKIDILGLNQGGGVSKISEEHFWCFLRGLY